LVFGFVLAQLQGFTNLLLRQSLAKDRKILAPNWLQYFLNRSNRREFIFRREFAISTGRALPYSRAVSKPRAYLLFICALIIGIIGGGLITSHWYRQHFSLLWADSAATQVEKDHTTLYYFRTGDTNKAVQLVEIDLDGQMAVLDSTLKRIPQERRDTNDVVILEHGREYRKAFPKDGMAAIHQ